jgi:hypothetical protein
MRYARYPDLGMFIDSGAIEAARKQMPVAQRAKQSGTHLTVSGAAAIIASAAARPAAPGKPSATALALRRARPEQGASRR